MSFSDISARMKKKQEETNPSAPVERNFEEIHTIRARILGVLIRDARIANGNSQEETARELGVDEEQVRSWEYGREAPSLPQLEMLAYFFGVPVSHFWSDKTLSAQQDERDAPIPREDYTDIRDHMIGTLLTMARKDARLSREELAQAAGLTDDKIVAYEYGQESIPFPELTSLSTAVRKSVSYFLEGAGRLGSWLELQEEYKRFSDLPEEIRRFVVLPVNQPFIDIAIRLSKMPLQDLRTVAEKILDITL